MPNRLQVTFLISTIVTFGFLLIMSNIITSQLNLTSDAINSEGTNVSHIVFSTTNSVKHIQQYLPAFIDMASINSALVGVFASPTGILTAVVTLLCTCVYIFLKINMPKRRAALDPTVWKEFLLQEKIDMSPNTALYRFALERPSDVLGLPIGQHISVAAEIDGKEIMRSYTPTSSDDDMGHFDLVVKTYEKGNISRYLSLIKVGQKVRIKGPKGQFKYTPDLANDIGMIAGGTGITPMLQIIRAALKNPYDTTRLSLIYANVNEDDILLRDELTELADAHRSRFKLYLVLNNPPVRWKGGVGFVTQEHIKEQLPATSDATKILLCGPPPMMTAMKKHLADLNYPAPRTVSKLVDQVFLF